MCIRDSGHTLLMGHIGTLAINPSLYASLPYDPRKSFVPVALVARVPNVLVVNPQVPAKDVRAGHAPEIFWVARRMGGIVTSGPILQYCRPPMRPTGLSFARSILPFTHTSSRKWNATTSPTCLLYTSDAADERSS